MKIEIKNILNSVAFLFCLLPVWTWAASYEVSTSTTTVDGDTFCGGSACSSSDTIIISGGARGSLRFQNFDGRGSYITIVNEGGRADRVVITQNMKRSGVLQLRDCKYVDLKGNNKSDFSWSRGTTAAEGYGIKVVNDGTPIRPSNNILIEGRSDHIKLSYIETEHTNSPTKGVGFGVHDINLTSAWTYDTIEIHHNYIHDTGYSGMYLGHNAPHNTDECTGGGDNTCPYLSNFKVYDNLLEDLGSYGLTLKGVKEGSVMYIYNNIIRPSVPTAHYSTAHTPSEPRRVNHGQNGINTSWYYDEAYAVIYNNWIEKTVAVGIKVTDANHLVYDNIILGAGVGATANKPPHLQSKADCTGPGQPYDCCTGLVTGDCWDHERWGHGISVSEWNSPGGKGIEISQIYDNIILQSARYGISDFASSHPYAILKRNLIVDSGIGEWLGVGGNVTEGTGDNSNIYEADADDVGFLYWIDDGDFRNDDFSLNNQKPVSKPITNTMMPGPVTGFRIKQRPL